MAWWALPDAAHSYEAFLLIIAYWVGPWLGVVFADQYLRRGQPVAHLLYDRSYTNWEAWRRSPSGWWLPSRCSPIRRSWSE